MTTPTHYSLWLMPSGQVNVELIRVISDLSQRYAAPLFPPHVTLLGGLTGPEEELATRTRQLATRLQPFEVVLSTVDMRDEYFRCLFLRAQETPALLAAAREARKLFQREEEEFMPHLSLLYGNYPTEIKMQIVSLIGREWNRPFVADQIHLFSTTGEPKDWYCVERFGLEGRWEASYD